MHTKNCRFLRKPPSQHSCRSLPLFLTLFICHLESNTIFSTARCQVIVNKMIFSWCVCVCICRRRQYSFMMLIYQLVRIKYPLVCVRVCVWLSDSSSYTRLMHLLWSCHSLTIYPGFPSALVDWFSHIKAALILIIYWLLARLSGVCEWYWLSNQCADCYGGRTIYSKLNAFFVSASSFDDTLYWFCIPHKQLLGFLFHEQSAV